MIKWDGLLPISGPGSRQAGPGARQRKCVRAQWRALHGLAIWCRDTVFGVATEGAAGASRHGFWCRNRKASLWAEVMSRVATQFLLS